MWRELNQSIAYYDAHNKIKKSQDVPTTAKDWMRSYLWNQSNTIMVLDNRVIVDSAFLRATGDKGRRHLRFLTTLSRQITRARRQHQERLPNVVYHFAQLSTGEGCPDDREPCLVIAKDTPARPGIMVPNPYFGDMYDWKDFVSKLRAAAEPRKFNMRDRRAFWRGAIMNYDEVEDAAVACSNEHGNFARLQALALTLAHPESVDAKCVHAETCRPRVNSSRCPKMPYGPWEEKVVADPPCSGEHVYEHAYSKYKYVLNLPGATFGSYSRNLNHLWAIGSVVLQWRNRALEWYYPALKHGDTHLDVDASDLVKTVKKLEGDAGLQYALRQGAEGVAQELLCPKCLGEYFRKVMESLREHWRMDAVLDDPCVFYEFIRAPETQQALNCSNLELIEIVSRYDDRLQSRSHSWHHTGANWLPPDNRHTNWLPDEKVLRTAYGAWTHSLVDGKPLGTGCAGLIRHAGHSCARSKGEGPGVLGSPRPGSWVPPSMGATTEPAKAN